MEPTLALLNFALLAVAADIAAAADIALPGVIRRELHQPLFPVVFTPPPPAPDFTSSQPPPSPPEPTPPDVFFPPSPPPPAAAAEIAKPAVANSPPQALPSRRIKASVVAIAAGVGTAVLILSLFACIFILSGRRSRRDGPPARAGPGIAADELIGSPYHKLGKERVRTVLEPCDHPSPELRPLPPLRRPSVAPTPLNRMISSDEEAYFTPRQRSVESPWSGGSPTSPAASRRSLPSISSSGAEKDAVVLSMEPSSVPPPMSRRTAPRTRFSTGSAPEVKLMIPPVAMSNNGVAGKPPPPPPLPPMPMLRSANAGKMVPPLPPLRTSDDPNSSSRRLVKPPLAETTKATIPMPASLATSSSTTADCFPLKKDDASRNNVEGDMKPKLKPLHWDKVRATSDRRMVWDQLSSGSFQLNEDMIEALFVNNATSSSAQKDCINKGTIPHFTQQEQVLDPKKAQNIAILLRALNVTREEVSEALLDGNPDSLGTELLETLIKMAPTKEEEFKLRDYDGDLSKLGSAERFLRTVLDVPFAFKRVDAMLYRANFEAEINYLTKSYETLEAACEDLRSSRLFLKLLEAVLKTGNRMNVGTNRGEAKAFKLDTLLKLADVKGTDGKTTLLHFVVQEIIRSEESKSEQNIEITPNGAQDEQYRKHGLKVVAGLSTELANVKRAAGMDFDVLHGYVAKLAAGVDNIKSVLKLEKQCSQGRSFFEAMKCFLQEAEREIERLRSNEKKALERVKEITDYFHGDAGKEEAHPLRIFMVVRDFLSTLDHVCRELGIKMQERAFVGSARSFRISAAAPVPVFSKFSGSSYPREQNSDEDSF